MPPALEIAMLTRRMLLAAVMAGTVSTAAAQTTTTTTTPTTTTTNNSGVGGANTGFTNPTQEAPQQITSGAASGAQVNGTNGFAGYYANPFYQGRPGSTGNDSPGGFGTAFSGGTGTASRNAGTLQNRSSTGTNQARTTGSTSALTGGSTTGSTGSRTGTNTTGTAVGQGFGSGFNTGTTGTTGFGTTGGRNNTGFGNTGFGNTRNSMFGGTQQNQPGIVIPQTSPVRYQASVRIAAPAIAPTALTTDLRGALDRSSFLTNARGIQITMDAGQVVLRGSVKDEDEAKTAEGIVRLTPGVRDVKNELKYPPQ
jgi:hypothetical protein